MDSVFGLMTLLSVRTSYPNQRLVRMAFDFIIGSSKQKIYSIKLLYTECFELELNYKRPNDDVLPMRGREARPEPSSAMVWRCHSCRGDRQPRMDLLNGDNDVRADDM